MTKVQFDGAQVDIGKVHEAEQMLREAGVTFDTGTALEGTHPIREWFLDGPGHGYNVVEK